MRKFLRILITIISIIFSCFLILLSIDILSKNGFNRYGIRFFKTMIKSVSTVVFLLFYNFSYSTDNGPDTLFITNFLLFSTISELRILTEYIQLTNIVVPYPVELTGLVIFSGLMSLICIIGYGTYYMNYNYSAAATYLIVAEIICAIVAYIIPKSSFYAEVFTYLPLHILLGLLTILCVATFIILVITENRPILVPRHIATIIISIGEAINLLYNNPEMNTLGLVLSLIGIISLIITSRIAKSTF